MSSGSSNTPWDALDRLRIGSPEESGMAPTTRAAARRAAEQQQAAAQYGQHEEDDDDDDEESEEEGEEDSSEAESSDEEEPTDLGIHVSQRTRLQYDLRALSPSTGAKAAAGLGGTRLSMTRCVDQSVHGYYAFQLAEEIVVRVGNETTGYSPPQCSCGSGNEERACKHIFWLEDQLAFSIPKRPEMLQFTQDGSHIGVDVHNVTPYGLIASLTFERISQQHGWRYTDATNASQRTKDLNDMMSVFNPSGVFPDVYTKQSEVAATEDWAAIQSATYKRFGDAVAGIAMQDDTFFQRLREVLTPSYCSRSFFTKASVSVESLFKWFGDFVQGGSAAQFDAATAAPQIENMVNFIGRNYAERQPLTQDTARYAVHLLLETFRRVVASGQTTVDAHNLYKQLIGAPSGPRSEYFFLGVLGQLPPDILRDYRNLFTRLVKELETSVNPIAPADYVTQLRILGGLAAKGTKRSSGESSGGSAKRGR